MEIDKDKNLARTKITLHLDDPIEAEAYKFLNKLGRKHSHLIAVLVYNFIHEHYNDDIEVMSKNEALTLAAFAKNHLLLSPSQEIPNNSLDAILKFSASYGHPLNPDNLNIMMQFLSSFNQQLPSSTYENLGIAKQEKQNDNTISSLAYASKQETSISNISSDTLNEKPILPNVPDAVNTNHVSEESFFTDNEDNEDGLNTSAFDAYMNAFST